MSVLGSKLLAGFGAVLCGFAGLLVFFFSISADVWSDRFKGYAFALFFLLTGIIMVRKSRRSISEIVDLFFIW